MMYEVGGRRSEAKTKMVIESSWMVQSPTKGNKWLLHRGKVTSALFLSTGNKKSTNQALQQKTSFASLHCIILFIAWLEKLLLQFQFNSFFSFLFRESNFKCSPLPGVESRSLWNQGPRWRKKGSKDVWSHIIIV